MIENRAVDRLPVGHELIGIRFPLTAASLCQARRSADAATLWIKSPNTEYPNEIHLRHIEAELRAAEGLPHGPRAAARVDDERTCWLLYEGHPGQPLQTDDRLTLPDFLNLAIPVTRVVERAHASGYFFGVLEPSCILVGPKEPGLVGAVRFEDRELTRPWANSVYAAPELLGRAGGDITLAADVYSLGCLFYVLLTGQTPLGTSSGTRLQRLMHTIPPLSGEHFPEPLTRLVMSMLASAPLARPAGMRLVLEALQELADGVHAVAPRLFALERLVARREELGSVLSAVEPRQQGDGVLLLVTGEPGVGKSRLLRDAKKFGRQRNCIIAEGKFDQVRHGRPYHVLLSALRSAIEQLLGDDDARFRRHLERFANVDRTLLGVLGAELPELAYVAGSLPIPPRLGPSETEHRFKRAFRHLLECLCDPVLPLWLVLDDLQWADRATVELLKGWWQAGLPPAFILICAFRPEEAANAPHVAELLAQFKEVARVHLQPLSLDGITALCDDAVPACRDSAALAKLVHQRSGGNPLHAIEVLKNLVENGALRSEGGAWRLASTAHRLSHMSDTVVELLGNRIQRFDAATRDALMAAACVGQEFSAVLLSPVLEQEPGKVAEALRVAEREGLLIGLESEDCYVFAHDRVQQAALALSEETFRTAVRTRLGRYYLKGASSSRQCLFNAVEYLNLVRPSLGRSERTELAQLNWQAALLAKEAIAYERAVPLASAFLEDAEGLTDEMRFSASLLLGECLFLSSELKAGEQALARAREVATTTEMGIQVCRTSLLLYQHMQRYQDAIDAGLRALQLLGYRLPAQPKLPRVLSSLLALLFKTRRLDPRQLPTRPDLTTPRDRGIIDILVNLWGPSFWISQNLNALVVVHLMLLTLRLGNTPSSAMAYVCYAVLNHVLFKRYEVAVQYGRVALAQLEVEGTAFVATRVRFLALTFFGAFERTPQENVRAYDDALKECISNGELVGSHLLDGIVTTLPIHGFSLASIHARLHQHERQARALGAQSTIELIALVRHWHRALSEDGTTSLDALLAAPVNFASYRGVRDLLAMQLAYLWHDDATVLSLAKRARTDMVVQANPLHRATFCLFAVLADCRSHRRVTGRVRAQVRVLQRFGRIFPANFRSLQLLAEAEVLGAQGRTAESRDRLRQALDEAAQRGHELVAAIAAERLAASYDAGGDEVSRDECLRTAAFSYERFGALAKGAQIKRRHPELGAWNAGAQDHSEWVDMRVEAVMHAASSIAEEVSSARLAPTLTRVIATATQAERALLIQKVGERWLVLAGWQRTEGDLFLFPVDLEGCDLLARGVVRYVCRTGTAVELGSSLDQRFGDEPYLSSVRPRSVLCLPLAHRGEVAAVIYLENSLFGASFVPDQVKLARLLGTQASIALANADNHRLQLEAVQSRVNPHFLYNALSVVAELIATSPERAEDVVIKLSRLYRSMLDSSVDRMVTLDQEMSFVRDYLELEAARFGDKFTVNWQVDNSFGTFRIPGLLLQPLVENAVHHGIRRKLDKGVVSVSARREGLQLVLGVADDGPGWYECKSGNGFGLRSVEKRLKLLYGPAAQLLVLRENGVSVEVRLPLALDPTA